MGVLKDIVVVAALALGLMGCAGGGGYQDRYDDGAQVQVGALAPMPGTARVDSYAGQTALQCVPYARDNSAIKIWGDAWTWWDQAAGKYERGGQPASGAVMVLHNYAGPNHGHVAVVRRIVGAREIRIDHANWTNDGSIYLNNPVMDVSPANDWSQVRVFNIKTGAWGGTTYPVKGFIGSGSGKPATPPPARAIAPTPPIEEDDAVPDEDLLLAQRKQPLLAAASQVARPAATAPRAALTNVSAVEAERAPPPGSPYALTAEDLAIP